MRAQASMAMASSHVDGDDIALLDSELLESVGEAAGLLLEVAVGEASDLGLGVRPVAEGLALPEDGEVVAVAVLDLAVDAVVAEVGLAADEPLGVGRVPVEDLGPRLEPSEFLGDAAPEAVGIFDGAPVECAVLVHGGDVPSRHAGLGRCRRGERAGLVEDRVNPGGGGGGHGEALPRWSTHRRARTQQSSGGRGGYHTRCRGVTGCCMHRPSAPGVASRRCAGSSEGR